MTLFEITCLCGQTLMLAQTPAWSPHEGTFFGSCICDRIWEVREISGLPQEDFREEDPQEDPGVLQYYTA